jgi:hypothetical protein
MKSDGSNRFRAALYLIAPAPDLSADCADCNEEEGYQLSHTKKNLNEMMSGIKEREESHWGLPLSINKFHSQPIQSADFLASLG